MISAYRQGDVLLKVRSALPAGDLKPQSGKVVLARGEVSGHAHVLTEQPGTSVYVAQDGTLWITSESEFTIDHVIEQTGEWTREHAPLVVPQGTYEVTVAREYDPYNDAVRRVQD